MRTLLLLTLLLLLPAAVPAEGRVFTLWPLVDYRHSPAVDYTSLSLLGPLLHYDRKGSEIEFGLRPLYFHARDTESGAALSEYLYPFGSRRVDPHQNAFQGLHLLQSDFGAAEKGSDNEFMLFPFVFYGRHPEKGPYFALFPVGGKLYERFWRDEIRFWFFPLFGQTVKKGTTTTNILWPFFAGIEGEGESGWKAWPLAGSSHKDGVYRKRFFLWPIFFRYDLALNTTNPVRKRAAFPFFVAEDSPDRSSRAWLWPFFSHIENRKKDFEEWNFPWPLLRVTRGSYKEGHRFLPFHAEERIGDYRKRWYLWPVYKIEELETDSLHRRRDRVLYFLYSDLTETADDEAPKRRTALWPLFTYEQVEGVSHFHTLSLLEPFFPENASIERNWSPLWRLYQRKWDNQGNEISSLLWNLYWKERRGDDLALELFPFVRLRREAGEVREVSILKGLFRFRQEEDHREVALFFSPWGFSWSPGRTGEGT